MSRHWKRHLMIVGALGLTVLGGCSPETADEDIDAIRETGYLACGVDQDRCGELLACQAEDEITACIPIDEDCEGPPTCACMGDTVCRQGRVCVDLADGSMACEDPGAPGPDAGSPTPDGGLPGPDAGQAQCEGLDEAACGEDPACAVFYGTPYPEACDPQPEDRQFVRCGPAPDGCDDALTCGAGPEGMFQFSSGCLPPGYGECPPIDLCSPQEVCPQLDEASCLMNPECQTIPGRSVCGAGEAGFRGCIDQQPCPEPDARTCARDPDSGEVVEFGDACTPAGWASVDCEESEAACDPCAGLAEAACEASAACHAYRAQAEGQAERRFVACGPALNMGCGEAETCGEDPATGTQYVFSNTCLPPGWSAAGGSECPGWGRGSPCEGLSFEVCVDEPSCAPISGRPWCSVDPYEFVYCGIAVEQGKPDVGICPTCVTGACVDFPGLGTIELDPNQPPAQLPDEYEVYGCDEAGCPAPECAELDQIECEGSPNCMPLLGAPSAEICVEDFSNWMSIFAGCVPVQGCGDAETCGEDPAALMEPLVFPDTCLPDGWVECSLEEVCR